jgi:hypothetical protein
LAAVKDQVLAAKSSAVAAVSIELPDVESASVAATMCRVPG